jgi:three-Cys-motif partner protein
MREFPVRKTQTKVKHHILSSYLDAWAGIIFWGLRSVWHRSNLHFVFVDCFAYTGQYSRDQDIPRENEPIYGSPIIGIRALDKLASYATNQGVRISTNVVLIERKPKNYNLLKETLSACGFLRRTKETADFCSLKNGEIALVNGNCVTLADKLVNYTNNPSTWAFYFLDPYGASGIPYEFVEKIIRQPNHDVMINFIYQDLVRKTGMIFNESLEAKHRWLVLLWKRVYGEEYWKKYVVETLVNIESHRLLRNALDGIPLDDMDDEFLTDSQLRDVKERALIYGYSKVLKSMDSNLSVKLSALKFPDKERTMLCLYLTTHDPTGALTINEVLHEAQLLEHELRYRIGRYKKSDPRQLSMFDVSVGMTMRPERARPTSEKIGEHLSSLFQGMQISRKEIFTQLVETDYFPSEIDKALRWLRRNTKAEFKGNRLTHKTIIKFNTK